MSIHIKHTPCKFFLQALQEACKKPAQLPACIHNIAIHTLVSHTSIALIRGVVHSLACTLVHTLTSSAHGKILITHSLDYFMSKNTLQFNRTHSKLLQSCAVSNELR